MSPTPEATRELRMRVADLVTVLGRTDAPDSTASYAQLERYWQTQLLEEVGCILSSSE